MLGPGASPVNTHELRTHRVHAASWRVAIRGSHRAVREPSAAINDPLLDLISEVFALLDLGEFRSTLLRALRRVVPAEWISLNDLGADPQTTVVLIDPPFPPEAHELFARHAFENPLVEHHRRTHDGRPLRFSDVVTAEQLHETALYQEFYGPIGLEHQIAFTLPHPPQRVLAVALSRRTYDFSDEERNLLDRARPFLIQAYRNASEHSALKADFEQHKRGSQLSLTDQQLVRGLAERGITRREAEVLSLVATGISDRVVAETVGVSVRTVQKHLQRCYAKFGVTTRAEAVALARSLADKT